ncbi:unnamed protein product [Arabidopsis lyrata]|uniref:Predicted protein n=1 Tax=Arabidopsis lyrata subsp. lyrata TaxID=81972 RepID=D7MIB9_ARALL|nr:predicted protein [Arabidopsis lyrata subsp. lyrata]CAH8277259.1 unnamed protein product [Arabidopsis lyrata]
MLKSVFRRDFETQRLQLRLREELRQKKFLVHEKDEIIKIATKAKREVETKNKKFLVHEKDEIMWEKRKVQSKVLVEKTRKEILVSASHEELAMIVDHLFMRQEYKSARVLYDLCVSCNHGLHSQRYFVGIGTIITQHKAGKGRDPSGDKPQ